MRTRKRAEQMLFRTIESSIVNDALKQRLVYLLEWYDGKAQVNRCCYHILRVLSVMLPNVVAALSLFTFLGGEPIIAVVSGVLSLLTSFLLHLLDQFRYYENWIRYRSTAETLKSEVFRCLNHGDPYYGETSAREHKLAITVEEIAHAETAKWQVLREENVKKGGWPPASKHE